MNLLFLLLAAVPARAATTADLFPGARANGIGAIAAIADDSQALFNNPAGLSKIENIDVSGSVGRTFQPAGPLTLSTLASARPIPAVNGAVGALGWQSLRLPGAGKRDVLLVGWSQPLEPLLGIPALVSHISGGLSLRAVSQEVAGKKENGFGADAGFQWEPNKGFRVGAAVLGAVSGIKDEKPVLVAGVARELGWVTLAADVRSRDGRSVIYPGAELHLAQGVLDLRLGKGVPVNGVRQAAVGWGVHLDPWVLDFAMTVPWRGFGVAQGSFQTSISYRFGAEPFTSRLLGNASQTSKRLQADLDSLLKEQSQVQRSVSDLEAARIVAQQDLRDVRFKLEEERIKLQAMVQASSETVVVPSPAAGPLAEPKPVKVAPAWPKKHRVAGGDTLRELAQKYYGDAGLWEQIYAANPDKVSRGLPEPGAELTIPAPKR